MIRSAGCFVTSNNRSFNKETGWQHWLAAPTEQMKDHKLVSNIIHIPVSHVYLALYQDSQNMTPPPLATKTMAPIDPLVKRLLHVATETKTASSKDSSKDINRPKACKGKEGSSTKCSKQDSVDWYVRNMLLATDRKNRKDEIRRQRHMEQFLDRTQRKPVRKGMQDERNPRTYQKLQHQAKRKREREAQFSKLASAVSKLKKKRESKP